jgi:hypothetical protein
MATLPYHSEHQKILAASSCPPGSGDGIVSAQTSTLIGAETGIESIAAVRSRSAQPMSLMGQKRTNYPRLKSTFALQHDQAALSAGISTTGATDDEPVPDTARSGRANAIVSQPLWYKKSVRSPVKGSRVATSSSFWLSFTSCRLRSTIFW